MGDIRRINSAFSDFTKIYWIIIESDSDDDSVKVLEKMSGESENIKFITLGNLKSKFESRTEILAHARNVYLEWLLSDSTYSDINMVAIADLNNLNRIVNLNSVRAAIGTPGWDMCTANQSGRYYDVWALRHRLWSPNDCWEQLDFYRRYSVRKNLTLNSSVNIRMLRIPKKSVPIEVESAFGGLALIKKSFISSSVMYRGLTDAGHQVCEHVSFCQEVRNQEGKILVIPSFINANYTDHSLRSTYIYSIFRLLGYPLKFIKKLVQ
jgi:hypothetical protein